MFSRSIARNLTTKYTMALNLNFYKIATNIHMVRSVNVPVIRTVQPQHQFSQQPNNLIVDYDYVKKASGDNSAVIIDVREPDEIKEHGKIPNSINIPLGLITSSLNMDSKDFQKIHGIAKPFDKDEIIFYCMIGKRSGIAQQNALSLGYRNAKNYLGSWSDWASKMNDKVKM